MTFTLTPYQQNAADDCVAELRDAQDAFTRRYKKKAIGLSAPTGAGKTVIATSVLERLRFGDAAHDPNPDLTVLWVTDDPALNRQTLDKMLLASGKFTDGDFIEIDSLFDQKRLEAGKMHFAHIHLFGKGTTSMQPSNSRDYGLWAMVANTVEAYGSDFLLVIDEAHKGTKGTKDAKTILDRLSHGGPNKHFTETAHPAAPVIFGITATPEDFRASLDRAGRSLEDVIVPVAEVRESGLIKDRIIAMHPGEAQPADATLLADAVKKLREVDAAWLTHCRATGDRLVEPLLVVQVEDGVSGPQMASYLAAMESEWSLLKSDAIAHSFESHAAMTVQVGSEERDVRYISPERIAGDNRLRVVFFKKALTTGWDCPRAEVMLSLRVHNDYTTIAQLIGRMVRTPLAGRIETDETLNWVTLYLPKYKKTEVAKVIQALNAATGDDFEAVIRPIDCPRRRGVPDEVFEALGGLPSATRVKKPWKSETDRLLGLARLLAGHDVLRGASAKARARLVGAIKTGVDVHKEEIEKAVKDVNQLILTSTVWNERTGEFLEIGEGATTTLQTQLADVERQYAAAVRALPDATGKWYWDDLCDEDDADPYEMKARVAALVRTKEMTAGFKAAIENAATDQINAWRTTYGNQVQMLGSAARREFDAAWNPQGGTLTAEIEVPFSIQVATERITGTGDNATVMPIRTWEKHIYAAGLEHETVPEDHFPSHLTGWEIDVLDKELSYPSLTGWYRNPPRSKHGLGVRYKMGDWGIAYPDFIFFHHVGDELAVDIVDPHQHNQADTGPKWAGLATWAAENRDTIRRAVAVIKVGADLKALNLTQDGITDRLAECHTKDDIEAVFDDLGTAY